MTRHARAASIVDTTAGAKRTITELEAVIESGIQTFLEVGVALKEISQERLYREQGFATFEEYCKQPWGWERRQAYNYIAAAEVVENVHSTAQSMPSLTQAVELSVLEPQQQREVASGLDFRTTSVRELKAAVKRVKQPQQIAADKTVTKPRHIVTAREVRHTALPKKGFEILIARIVKRYERSHVNIDCI